METLRIQNHATYLEQDIDLGSGLVKGLLDGDWHPVNQLGQFQLLLFPHNDVLELITQGKEAQQLNVAHGGFQVLIVGGNGVVSHVVMAGNTPQVSYLKTNNVVLDDKLTRGLHLNVTHGAFQDALLVAVVW